MTLEPAVGGYVVVRGAVAVRLTTPAVAFLLLVDGVRTIENLEHLAASLAMPLPDGFAPQLLEALVTGGLGVWVRAADIDCDTPPDLAHACDGCGRSCEGHLVGPLPDSEIETLQRLWPELVRRLPRLSGHKPMVLREEDGGVFLQRQDGRCLFLEDDRRCAIHREFGPLQKPSICRMFPYQRVLTEAGVRLGISAACYRHHVTVASAAPTDVRDLPEIVLDREGFQQLALSAPPPGRAGALEQIRQWADGLETLPIPRPEPALVDRLLARFAGRLWAAPWTAELLAQSTEVTRGFRLLLAAIALASRAPDAYDDALREMLVRMHFVRETEVLGGSARAVAAMTLGHHLCARASAGGEGEHVERLVAWFWLLTTQRAHLLLLDGEHEVNAVLGRT